MAWKEGRPGFESCRDPGPDLQQETCRLQAAALSAAASSRVQPGPGLLGAAGAALCCRPRWREGRQVCQRLPRTPPPARCSRQGAALFSPGNVWSTLVTGVICNVCGKHTSNHRQRLRGPPSSCVTRPLGPRVLRGRRSCRGGAGPGGALAARSGWVHCFQGSECLLWANDRAGG